VTKVWLIRHAESEANAGLSTTTPSAIPLTDAGWKQAKQISLAFERQPTLIVTSSYLRAIQTAQPTIEHFPNTPSEIWDVHEFTYLSPEKLGNTSKAERRPLVKSFWANSDPYYSDGTGAESFSDFLRRIEIMKEKLLAIDEGFVAIFCHGFVIKAVLWANLINSFTATPDYMRNFYTFHTSFSLNNGSIIEGQYNPKSIMLSGIITEHLS
jgi:broad specificity phosphatase PhoE